MDEASSGICASKAVVLDKRNGPSFQVLAELENRDATDAAKLQSSIEAHLAWLDTESEYRLMEQKHSQAKEGAKYASEKYEKWAEAVTETETRYTKLAGELEAAKISNGQEKALLQSLIDLLGKVKWMQGSYLTMTLHFLMHGVHHLLPMDPMRLVFPPVLTCVLLCPIHATFRLLLPYPEAVCLTAGGLLGYVGYDLTHYYLHHSGKSWLSYFVDLKSYHLAHHYKQHRLGYGITSKLWDHVFGTVLHLDRPAAAPASGKAKAG